MSINDTLSDIQIAEFHENGLLILPSFFDLSVDIKPIQKGIYNIIGQVMLRHGIADSRSEFTPEKFDDYFQTLISINRDFGSEIYDAVKQIPAFNRLCAHPKLEDIFRVLRPGSLPGLADRGCGIRIDNPNEELFRAPWHQEYPAQLRSLDGLVFCSPLLPISSELGPIRFCLGSHKNGVIPVYTSDPKNSEKSGAYALVLKDEEHLISQYAQVAPLTNPGDLVVVDWLTLHASGENRGARSRWSMQLRYFNFAETTGVKNGWKGSFAADVDFRTIHPELCLD